MARKKKQSSVKVTKAAPKPLAKAIYNMKFSRLKPITIETGHLVNITIVSEKENYSLEFKDSWIELILTLMGMVYERNEISFMTALANYNILSDGVMVHKTLIEYPECEKVEREIYKLNNSIYYIEIRKNKIGADYIKAIKGLFRAVGIKPEEVLYDIIPIGEKQSVLQKELKLYTKSLQGLFEENKFDFNIKSIELFGYEQPVKSNIQALILFMTWAYNTYENKLAKVGLSEALDGVGMTTIAKIDEYGEGFTTHKMGDNYLYTCDDTYSILKYMYKVSLKIGLSPELVILKYEGI